MLSVSTRKKGYHMPGTVSNRHKVSPQPAHSIDLNILLTHALAAKSSLPQPNIVTVRWFLKLTFYHTPSCQSPMLIASHGQTFHMASFSEVYLPNTLCESYYFRTLLVGHSAVVV
jgi:hypothetical protein